MDRRMGKVGTLCTIESVKLKLMSIHQVLATITTLIRRALWSQFELVAFLEKRVLGR